ncbi:MAG: phosphate ABC transporter permease subunit PstC [Thermodesulfobacteriota bacterium]
MNDSETSIQTAAVDKLRSQVRIGVELTPLTEKGDAKVRRIFMALAFFSVIVMGLIVLFLFKEGIGLLGSVNLSDFLLGRRWLPTFHTPYYGILPLVAGSMAVTLVSSLIAVPLGVATALYLSAVASDWVREWVKPAIELLASLPSVVLGFLGLVVISPLMQSWGVNIGLNVLNASLMLALMAIPTITSISEDALHSVPREWLEASYALGATQWETVARVLIPGALSGIGTAVILGMSRAMGETMVVLMVAGGAAQLPSSLFQPVRPMPATIASEMGETPFGSDHYHALFAIGIVLFVLVLVFNLLAAWISHRFHQKGSATL